MQKQSFSRKKATCAGSISSLLHFNFRASDLFSITLYSAHSPIEPPCIVILPGTVSKWTVLDRKRGLVDSGRNQLQLYDSHTVG